MMDLLKLEKLAEFRQERPFLPCEIAPVQPVVTGDIEKMPGKGLRVLPFGGVDKAVLTRGEVTDIGRTQIDGHGARRERIVEFFGHVVPRNSVLKSDRKFVDRNRIHLETMPVIVRGVP